MCSVHCDDFTVSGPCCSLDWFEVAMKNKYELTVGGRLGPGPNDDKEISVLNKIICWTPKGIQYEADPCQVEKLLREIELEGANGAVTPGQKILAHQVESEVELRSQNSPASARLHPALTTWPPTGLMFYMLLKKFVASCLSLQTWPWGR